MKRLTCTNLLVMIFLPFYSFASDSFISHLYCDIKFSGAFEGGSYYNSVDTTYRINGYDIFTDSGNVYPYYIDASIGYLFEKPTISLFLTNRFGFEKDFNDYALSIGIGKFIKIGYTLTNTYALIGYSWDKISYNHPVSYQLSNNYPLYCFGIDTYLKFIPYCDFVIGYRFGIASKEKCVYSHSSYTLEYDPAILRHDVSIGFSFGNICSSH